MNQKVILAALLLLCVTLPIVSATKGIDLSASFNNFACVKSAGYSFAIVRGYMSYGAVDTVGLANLKHAKAAGLIGDAYFFPCKGKKTVDQQVNEFIGSFGNEHFNDPNFNGMYEEQLKLEESPLRSEYGTVWVDVEHNPSTGCGWTTNHTDNCTFLKSLINAFKAKGKLVGIYGSKYQWETIFGTSTACASFTTLPLWYAHYDNVASFSDYSKYAFGGWTKPAMKQYTGDTTLCGVGVDLNCY